jgi:hypothetical protein
MWEVIRTLGVAGPQLAQQRNQGVADQGVGGSRRDGEDEQHRQEAEDRLGRNSPVASGATAPMRMLGGSSSICGYPLQGIHHWRRRQHRIPSPRSPIAMRPQGAAPLDDPRRKVEPTPQTL